MTGIQPDVQGEAPLLEARHITKVFRDNLEVTVLKDLDLTLRSGEMVAVVGTSGTGKSTLLHVLGTLERPTEGELYFSGTEISTFPARKLATFRNRSIGFVFQFHHLLPEFTALENIMMPGLISGANRGRLLDDAHTLLEKIGLENRARHKIGELSGGEQQRVAIARALILKPALLLADEPTGNLDPVTGRKIFDLLVGMNETFRLTTIMVTHNLALADHMDRCLVLSNGRLDEK